MLVSRIAHRECVAEAQLSVDIVTAVPESPGLQLHRTIGYI